MKVNYYRNFDFKAADKLIKSALKEDTGRGDITSETLIPRGNRSKARILIKEDGTAAGLEIFKRVFKLIDSKVKATFKLKEGDAVKKSCVAGYLEGSSRSILRGERTALNILQHMSGVATRTRKFVDLLNDKSIKILDTRKTTPNLRMFEKLAVKIGGGDNHRFGLYDMMLIKDNHINANGGIGNTLDILKGKKKILKTKVEIEVQNIEELKTVIAGGKGIIDIIMLDNFTIPDVKKAVRLIDKKFKIEVSGGINERSIVKYKGIKGVDFISVGALTHSVNSLDISLDFM